MADNQIYDVPKLSVVCTHPTAPGTGEPCRLGNMVGVALTDEDSAGETVVDFREGMVYDLSVKAHNGSGNTAISIGDQLFYDDSVINDGTGPLNVNTSDIYAGIALEAINSGVTDTIRVFMEHSRP